MARVENGPATVVLGASDRAAAIAAVKARLRVAVADEDALIAAFAETALGLAEQVIGQATIMRAMAQELSGGGGWQQLAARPVTAIGDVLDRAGQPLSLGSYAIDVDADGLGWIRLPAGAQVDVRFSAGIAADWGALPAAIRDGAAMLAAHLFDDRTGAQPIPVAVTALWRPFRVIQLGSERRMGVGA